MRKPRLTFGELVWNSDIEKYAMFIPRPSIGGFSKMVKKG